MVFKILFFNILVMLFKIGIVYYYVGIVSVFFFDKFEDVFVSFWVL